AAGTRTGESRRSPQSPADPAPDALRPNSSVFSFLSGLSRGRKRRTGAAPFPPTLAPHRVAASPRRTQQHDRRTEGRRDGRGISAFAVHQKTGEHLQTQQQRHGQRESEREDGAGCPHQGDRPGQPGPEEHK
ncbi:hypothetical protein LDENG_00259740, partial [Lucifuga dentata]